MSSMSEGAEVADLVSIRSVWQHQGINVERLLARVPLYGSCVTSVEHIANHL